MWVTKKYFSNFQYMIVGACVLSAIVVGTIQSAFIIKEIKKS